MPRSSYLSYGDKRLLAKSDPVPYWQIRPSKAASVCFEEPDKTAHLLQRSQCGARTKQAWFCEFSQDHIGPATLAGIESASHKDQQ